MTTDPVELLSMVMKELERMEKMATLLRQDLAEAREQLELLMHRPPAPSQGKGFTSGQRT